MPKLGTMENTKEIYDCHFLLKAYSMCELFVCKLNTRCLCFSAFASHFLKKYVNSKYLPSTIECGEKKQESV